MLFKLFQFDIFSHYAQSDSCSQSKTSMRNQATRCALVSLECTMKASSVPLDVSFFLIACFIGLYDECATLEIVDGLTQGGHRLLLC